MASHIQQQSPQCGWWTKSEPEALGVLCSLRQGECALHMAGDCRDAKSQQAIAKTSVVWSTHICCHSTHLLVRKRTCTNTNYLYGIEPLAQMLICSLALHLSTTVIPRLSSYSKFFSKIHLLCYHLNKTRSAEAILEITSYF